MDLEDDFKWLFDGVLGARYQPEYAAYQFVPEHGTCVQFHWRISHLQWALQLCYKSLEIPWSSNSLPTARARDAAY